MTARPRLFTAAVLAAATFAGTAGAQIAQMTIGGAPTWSFDISYVDQASQRYLLADRTNKGIDVFDAKGLKFIGRAEGFTGLVFGKNGKPDNDHSGPNGVLMIGDEIWASDAEGKVRVIDGKTLKITDTIETGGKGRADEMAYDPKDHIFMVAVPEDENPFVALISTEAGHKVLGKIPFPDATDGAEQPSYNEKDGMFYQPIPELKGAANRGAIAVIDPRGVKVVRMMPLGNCAPRGTVFGQDNNLFIGCAARGKEGMAPREMVINPDTGATVAVIPQFGGTDEVAYSAKNAQYYVGAANSPAGHVLGVIDAKKNEAVDMPYLILRGNAPHSVAVNDATGQIFVPTGSKEGGCGCINVFQGPL